MLKIKDIAKKTFFVVSCLILAAAGILLIWLTLPEGNQLIPILKMIVMYSAHIAVTVFGCAIVGFAAGALASRIYKWRGKPQPYLPIYIGIWAAIGTGVIALIAIAPCT